MSMVATVVRFKIRPDFFRNFLAAADPQASEIFHPHDTRSRFIHGDDSKYRTYFVMGQGREEMLSWFSADARKAIVAWEIRVPTADLSKRHIRFGFYPENEHELWQKLYGSRASSNLDSGVGVAAMPREEYVEEAARFVLST